MNLPVEPVELGILESFLNTITNPALPQGVGSSITSVAKLLGSAIRGGFQVQLPLVIRAR